MRGDRKRAPLRAGPFPFSHGGFTLVEMVMIIVILGILAVVAIPRFTGGTPYESLAYFDEVAAASRYAQKVAVGSGCLVRVGIGSGGYTLHQAVDCSSGAFSLPVQHPATREPFARSTPAGVTLSGSDFVFTGRGGLAGGSDATVTVSNGGSSRSFTVVGATGYVVRN